MERSEQELLRAKMKQMEIRPSQFWNEISGLLVGCAFGQKNLFELSKKKGSNLVKIYCKFQIFSTTRRVICILKCKTLLGTN